MRKLALGFCAFALIASSSLSAFAASSEDAREFVDSVGKQTVSIIGDAEAPKKKKQVHLEKLFSEAVDIPWVGKFVLGRYWRMASEEQRARYVKEYQNFITTLYAGRFTDYSSGAFKITGTQDDGEDSYTVSMELIMPGSQQPVAVDYRVHPDAGGKLRVFDVIVEGVSLITTQRSEFASILESKGIDYLTDQMANKTLTVAADPREAKSN